MNFIKKNPTLTFGLILTFAFLCMTVLRVEFLDALSLRLYDTGLKLKSYVGDNRQIAIVDIDDDSIEKLGRWPWPRTLIAEGIKKIQLGNPSVIGVNIIYSEPEDTEGIEEIKVLEGIFRDDFLPENMRDVQVELKTAAKPESDAAPEADKKESAKKVSSEMKFLNALTEARYRLDRDSILAEAIDTSGHVVLPIFFRDSMISMSADKAVVPEIKQQAIGTVTKTPTAFFPEASQATIPIDKFLGSASGMGHINCAPDHDGTYRRERLVYKYKNIYIPSYSLVLAAQHLGITNNEISAKLGSQVCLGNTCIPMTDFSETLISFQASPKAFSHYSFFDVINDKIPPQLFKDKIILISLSAKGVGAPLSTPVTPSMSFGDFTATIVSSILNRQFISELPSGRLIELLSILVLGLLITFVFSRSKAAAAGLIFFLIVITLVVGSLNFLIVKNIWVDMMYPLLFIIIGYIGVVTIQYFVAESGKEKVEGESAETNRMLGVSFQDQGMLDMAFDKFRKVPVDDGMKDILYNLALDYERKRQFNKAASVYEYIEQYDAKFKDVVTRKQKLLQASETMVFGDGFFGGGSGGGLTSNGGSDVCPTLGRYEVQKQLGKGAMGVVYLGQDPRINRTTAIKTVSFADDFAEDEADDMKNKFFREAESAGTLSHPNIVTIYDAGEEQDLAYIAMEYLDGDSLEKHAKKSGLLPIDKVIGYVADIADALDYAHQQGIVHRDIKPANIMLSSGKIKITDFGIARITSSSQTKTGIVKGTPYYMSPEQISGKKVDGRSDLFSLGVMLFQLLTGAVPFRGDSPAALMHKILNEVHPDPRTINPKIPKTLVAIINKSLEKDMEKRYRSGGKMAEHLRALKAKIDIARQRKQTQ